MRSRWRKPSWEACVLSILRLWACSTPQRADQIGLQFMIHTVCNRTNTQIRFFLGACLNYWPIKIQKKVILTSAACIQSKDWKETIYLLKCSLVLLINAYSYEWVELTEPLFFFFDVIDWFMMSQWMSWVQCEGHYALKELLCGGSHFCYVVVCLPLKNLVKIGLRLRFRIVQNI